MIKKIKQKAGKKYRHLKRRMVYKMQWGYHKHHLPDKLFLKIVFKVTMGYKLNLKNPKTFAEKLNWLKLYNRKPIYTTMVDKYEAKNYVAGIIGPEYIVPNIGAWDKVEEIPFDELPEKCVLKPNHCSNVFIKNKDCFVDKEGRRYSVEEVKSELNDSLNDNYYYHSREWPYKNVKRRIICEQYMEDKQYGYLPDYKFYCFNGYADCVMICLDRGEDTKFYFFDKDWKLLRINKRGKSAPEGFTIPKPKYIDKMFEIAGKLSEGIPFVRVDLYSCNDIIYFGELTFFPSGGFDGNYLPEANDRFTLLLKIEE